jgi:hypothetical protein
MNYTQEQRLEMLRQFARYVRVQRSGRYNMFDSRAASAACLTKEQMCFIMEHYDELERAAKEAGHEPA